MNMMNSPCIVLNVSIIREPFRVVNYNLSVQLGGYFEVIRMYCLMYTPRGTD